MPSTNPFAAMGNTPDDSAFPMTGPAYDETQTATTAAAGPDMKTLILAGAALLAWFYFSKRK